MNIKNKPSSSDRAVNANELLISIRVCILNIRRLFLHFEKKKLIIKETEHGCSSSNTFTILKVYTLLA